MQAIEAALTWIMVVCVAGMGMLGLVWLACDRLTDHTDGADAVEDLEHGEGKGHE